MRWYHSPSWQGAKGRSSCRILTLNNGSLISNSVVQLRDNVLILRHTEPYLQRSLSTAFCCRVDSGWVSASLERGCGKPMPDMNARTVSTRDDTPAAGGR